MNQKFIGSKTMIALAIASMMAGTAFAHEDGQLSAKTNTVVSAEEGKTNATINYASQEAAKAELESFVNIVGNIATVKDADGQFGSAGTANFVIAHVTDGWDKDTPAIVVSNGTLEGFTGPDVNTKHAGLLFTIDGTSALKLSGMSVKDNKAAEPRGMVRAEKGGKLDVADGTFTGNEGVLGAALSYFEAEGSVVNSRFADNKSASHGGAMYVTGGKVAIENAIFTDNEAAKQGGALQVSGGNFDTTLTLKDVVFSGNKSTISKNVSTNLHAGGALMVNGGGSTRTKVSAQKIEFTNNTVASGNGGALAVTGGGDFDLKSGSFTGNQASGGGAVAVYHGNASFTDVDFRDNRSNGWGGAVMVDVTGSTVEFRATEKDVVVAGNTAGDASSFTGKLYDGYTGGFLHLKGATTADFDIAEGRTMTIGQAGSAATRNLDSITSSDSSAVITKTGEGSLVINSNTQAFAGKFNVSTGSVEMATGIGEYQIKPDAQAAFTVADHASAKIGTITGGKTTYTNNGELTIDTLHFTKDHALAFMNNDVLTIGAVVVDEDAKAATITNGEEGEVYTSWRNLFTTDTEADTGYVKSDFMNAIEGGTIIETEYTGDYDLDDLKKLNTGDQKFAFENATLNNKKDGSRYTLADVEGLPYVKATVDNADVSAEVSKTTGISVLNFALTEADKNKDVSVSASNAVLSIDGDVSGNLITGVAADKVITFKTESGSILLGESDKATKLVNSAAFEGDVTVNGNLSAQKSVSIGTKGNLLVAEGARVSTLDGVSVADSGKLNIAGTLSTKFIESSADNTDDAGINVAGTLVVTGVKPGTAAARATPEESATFENAFDGSWLTGAFAKTQGAVIAFAENESSLADIQAYFGDKVDAHKILYVGGQVKLADAGLTIADATAENENADTLMVNLGAAVARAGFNAEDGILSGDVSFNAEGEGSMSLVFTNLTQAATVLDENGVRYVKLATGITNNAGQALDIDLGSQYYDVTNAIDGTNGRVYFNVDDELVDRNLGDFWGVDTVKQSLAGVNIDSNRLVSQLARAEFDGDTFDRAYAEANGIDDLAGLTDDALNAYQDAKAAAENGFYDRLANEASTVANMAAAGGVYNVMLDAIEQNAKVLNRRMTVANSIVRAESGVTPWVDVFGTWNTADSLYGSSGYEADIYGAAFGADWTAPCGAIIGAAVTIGTGDANSVDAATKVDNDVDFYGFSIYGAHQVGNFNGKIDIGYMRTENDLKSSVMGTRYSEDLDADAYTLGIGGEYLVSAGAFNVVPHVGMRYTHLTVDDLSIDVSNESMNVFQLPVGVTVSGSFETAGMKVAPMFDLSFVPAFGDKDAVAKFGSAEEVTRVVDTNPIQATLGLNAQIEAWTFGINYELGVGADERLDNAFNFSARYVF